MDIFFFLTGLLMITFISLFFFMKWRMKVSKGRFAIVVVSSIVTCFLFAVASMSTSLPVAIISKISESLGFGSIVASTWPTLVAFLTIVIASLLFKFGTEAIKNWDVSPRVSEIDLAEKSLENDVFALSLEKFKLLFKWQSDPVASDAVANWKAKITEVPKPIEIKDLLRDMLMSAIREIRIPENSWRDNGRVWIGEILGLTNIQTKKILALIFDFQPNEGDIEARIKELEEKFDRVNDFDIFVLYMSSGNDLQQHTALTIRECKVRVLASRQMVLMGLDLVSYAKELISNFENTRVGGTSATLSNSYVDLNVKVSGKSSSIMPVNDAIENWLKKDTNCHLAITGEYGQGKSTALMKFCINWAERFLESGHIGERVPLLIELRGQSPSETDPLGFISAWCARYGLMPQQVMNLIKSGDAIIIFEGFDELRNAGRSYFRHQHFNALWRFAYPNTKLIFTGRPNFFLDEEESNRTLRSQTNREISGDNYSEVWKLQKLNNAQIKLACRSYEPSVMDGISLSAKNSSDFLEIVSRPSMLPVVATIWPEIERLQASGHPLTGAELIERYIQAVFSRKEAELEKDRIRLDAPTGSRYLILPKQLRELLTICVAWRMSGLNYKNTIPRSEITDMVREIYDVLISVGKSEGVSDSIAEGIVDFERRYADESFTDKIEAIAAEICSAGLLTSDAAGGATNLRFPHKQFFEFLIAKGIKITSQLNASGASIIILKSSNDKRILNRTLNEPNSIVYLSESIGQNFSVFITKPQALVMLYNAAFGLLKNQIDFSVNYLTYKMLKLIDSKKVKSVARKLINVDNYQELPLKLRVSYFRFFSSLQAGFLSAIVIALSIKYFMPKILVEEAIGIDLIFTFIFIIALIIPLIIFKQEYNVLILTKYIESHWKRANQRPKTKSQALKIIFKSLLKGKVIFPNEQAEERSNFEQFLYPAGYF